MEVLQTSALPLGYSTILNWSGLRGSNSLPPPWQGGALPDELKPQTAGLNFALKISVSNHKITITSFSDNHSARYILTKLNSFVNRIKRNNSINCALMHLLVN